MSDHPAASAILSFLEGHLPSPLRIDRRASMALEEELWRFRTRLLGVGFSPAGVSSLIAKGLASIEVGSKLCESPIEEIMLGPLVFAEWSGFETTPIPVYPEGADDYAPDVDILIVPQMRFARFRADFAIICQAHDARKIFFVECDGREFHQDVRHDQQRDNYLKALGVTLIRLTGSEIHTSPRAALQRIQFVVSAWKDSQRVISP